MSKTVEFFLRGFWLWLAVGVALMLSNHILGGAAMVLVGVAMLVIKRSYDGDDNDSDDED